MTAYFAPSLIDGAPYLAPADAQSLNPGPTGAIMSQPAPSGQSQWFVLDMANVTSGSYTLIGQNGAANVGPVAFDIAGNAADFTVTSIPPATYAPTITLVGPNGTAQIPGASFTVVGVSGGVSGTGGTGGGTGGGTTPTPTPTPTVSSVTITPVTATLAGGAPLQFLAVAAGANNPAQTFTWTRAPLVGALSTAGLFTAPDATNAEQVIVVKATSQQDPNYSATATVTVPAATMADTGFVRSKARTVKIKPAPLTFEGGAFWDMRDPKHPVGVIDKDATIDITFDWSEVLADIGDTIDGVHFDIDGLTSRGGFTTGGFATIFVAEPTGQPRITCRIKTASVPPRIEDRSVFLRIEEE